MSHTAQTARLAPETLAAIQAMLRERGWAGWLLFDFRGGNRVAGRLLGLRQPLSRRYAVLVPADGPPVALAHAIELGPWRAWPGPVRTYRSWEEWEEGLRKLLPARGPVAIEYAARGRLPTVDLVPAGFVDLLREAGVELVSSADLVTRFEARWSEADLRAHRRAAATLAETARAAFEHAAAAAAEGRAPTEWTLRRWILDRLANAGLHDADAIVASGPRSADPHYEPSAERHGPIECHAVLLIDLWGRAEPETVFADQTWMGFTGARPPDELARAWAAVRDARDAAIAHLRERWAAGAEIRGCDLDRVARARLAAHGYADAILHRTGHSIDRELHGAGPNLDSYETEDVRILQPWTGMSVEPAVYRADAFGVRSEVNVVLLPDGPEVTPAEPQQELWIAPSR